MNFPIFSSGAYEIKKKVIDSFGGLSRDEGAYENEFADTKQISCDAYPHFACLYDDIKKDIMLYDIDDDLPHTPKVVQGAIIPNIYIGKEMPPFCGVCDNKFYFDGKETEIYKTDKIEITDGKKELIDFYGKIVILPDMLFYCYTAEYDEYKDKEGIDHTNWNTLVDGKKYLRKMGKGFDVSYINDFFGRYPGAMHDGGDDVLISFVGSYNDHIKEGDTVTVEQCDENGAKIEGSILNIENVNTKFKKTSLMQAVTGRARLGEAITEKNGNAKKCIFVDYTNSSGEVINKEYKDDFKSVAATYLTQKHYTGGNGDLHTGYFNIRQTVPRLVCSCVRDNRLWGSDKDGHIIYASKLGSIDEWNAFEGFDSDSFTAEVGTDGEFLRFITYKSALVGFKKDHIHILYGNTPKTYRLTKSISIGLTNKEGVAELDGVIYFNSYDGIYAFTLGVPEKISDKLNKSYESAHFVPRGKKLYIYGTKNGKSETVVYDTRTHLWVKKNGEEYNFLFGDGKNVYASKNEKIYLLDGKSADEATEWEAVTNYITDSEFGRKCITDLYFSADIFKNAHFCVYISYDDGKFLPLKEFGANDRYVTRMPVRIKSADRYRLKFSGVGRCEINGIEKRIRISGRNMRR